MDGRLVMQVCKTWIGAGLLLAVGGAALADSTSEVLFRQQKWMVEDVTFDDGTVACLAEVDDPNDSFSIWTYPDKTIKLQFYSTSWDFGDKGDTADLELQIDRRAKWTLTGADLYKNSVLFTLPGVDDSVNLLTEVAAGNQLHLRNGDGSSVMDYTLAGSSASMSAMIDCGTAISRSSNPFKK
jgi:hypothetical protein